MNITIDCRLIDEVGGIFVYLRECLPFFLDSPNSFLLVGNAEKLRPLTSPYTNVQIIDYRVRIFSLKELLFPPPALLKAINKTDLYYSPFFNIPKGISVPVYTTIHDIVFLDMPEMISKTGLFLRKRFYKRAAARSTKIFTVSCFSKARIEYHLGTKVPVIVTYSALQPYLKKIPTENIEKTDTLIFIGNIKKHKGLSYLLDAFAPARQEGLKHKLIIVGEKEKFRTSDKEIFQKIDNIDPAAIEFTGFIDDEKLKKLLAEAALLVQPSLYEGFGLLPLEAMTLGTGALISDIPVFREIYRDFPVEYFKKGDAVDLKDRLLSLLYNKPPVKVQLSAAQIDRYTFRKTASIILKEFSE
ncbi:glycosyl transferase [Spirochaetia bacterium]|nr:glycosyl transferase [Spirochaetia bacterium]